MMNQTLDQLLLSDDELDAIAGGIGSGNVDHLSGGQGADHFTGGEGSDVL